MQVFNITIFGIIAFSLDVRIVHIFVFHAIRVRLHLDLNTHPIWHCAFLSGKEHVYSG